MIFPINPDLLDAINRRRILYLAGTPVSALFLIETQSARFGPDFDRGDLASLQRGDVLQAGALLR